MQSQHTYEALRHAGAMLNFYYAGLPKNSMRLRRRRKIIA
jgi:hypothetical protein